MIQTVEAVYEKGSFKPLGDIHLPEQQRVRLIFLPQGDTAAVDDLPAWALTVLTEQSRSFDFLADPREDIYSLEDGEPIS
jgi:hypothetical protein